MHDATAALVASRSERRRWRAVIRRLEHDFEVDQLAALRGLAGAAIEAAAAARPVGLLAGPVQLTVGPRRLALGRVQAAAWSALRAAVGAGPVTLAGAGRYGRGWVLSFQGPHTTVAVLTDLIRFLPDDGGAVGDQGTPRELLAS